MSEMEVFNVKNLNLQNGSVRAAENLDVNSLQNGTNKTGNTKQRKPIKIVQVEQKKSVSANDFIAAQNERPVNAVKFLMEKSPLGMKNPTQEEILNDGFLPVYHMNEDGSTDYIGSEGKITKYPADKDGNTKVIYRQGNYIQEMLYDKSGKIKQGTMTLKDDIAGFEIGKYTFWTDENGRFSVMN